MSTLTLAENIAKWNAAIARYDAELIVATTPAEKSELRGLIKAGAKVLVELLLKQERRASAAPVGKTSLTDGLPPSD
jgi:hypothetical protein